MRVILLIMIGFGLHANDGFSKIFLLDNNSSSLVKLEVVRSYKDRVRGLAGVKNIGWDEGMLFEYKEEQMRSIWMKNMLMPLDIVFLSQDKKVILLVQNAQPCQDKECEIYSAKGVRYIIELKSGYIQKYNISKSSQIDIEDKP